MTPPMAGGAPAPEPDAPPRGPVTIDDVMELLRDGSLRRFRVDIEVDSTIVGDESQERQDRTEFLTALTAALEKWMPLVQGAPPLLDLAKSSILFGVRAFRVGRELEEAIEDCFDKLEQMAAQAAQNPPPPDPKVEAEKVKLAGTQVKAQAEAQKSQMDTVQAQTEAQARERETMLDHHIAAEQHALDAAKMQREAIRDAQAHTMKLEQMEQQARHAKEAAKDKAPKK